MIQYLCVLDSFSSISRVCVFTSCSWDRKQWNERMVLFYATAQSPYRRSAHATHAVCFQLIFTWTPPLSCVYCFFFLRERNENDVLTLSVNFHYWYWNSPRVLCVLWVLSFHMDSSIVVRVLLLVLDR